MLKAISPLDDRYYKRVEMLGDYFSEYALMGARIWIELQYLLALDKTKIFPALGKREIKRIEQMSVSFTQEAYEKIKDIEVTLNHDVKACEVYLFNELKLKHPNMVHFGLTSEDVNNIAYSLLIKKYCDVQQLPQLQTLLRFLAKKITEWRSVSFPSHTHGQMASPTTAGKELAVFASRLLHQYSALKKLRFRAKCNGATGNYSAFVSASSNIKWVEFSRKFLYSLDLDMNPVTTQIEDHDTWAEYFFISKMINNILLDMNEDVWTYLMLGYMKQKTKNSEVGSSTMPHKVNPINFENSEGNLGISNALLDHFTTKLTRSRLQRDLSDSTVERNIGVALGHAYLGLDETLRGLKKLRVNAEFCENELNNYPELLAEPIQTILRREGFENPYNIMKNITRGHTLTVADLNKFISSLKVSDEVRKELSDLRAVNYTGIADKICNDVVREINKAF